MGIQSNKSQEWLSKHSIIYYPAPSVTIKG